MEENREWARLLTMRRVERATSGQAESLYLGTTTQLSAEEMAQAYKGLSEVEPTFREQKSTLKVRHVPRQGEQTVSL